MKTVNKDLKVIIHNEFSDDLEKEWQQLYLSEGGSYNLSFDWCKIWFKYFGQHRKPFIITLWKADELKLLVPLYIQKDVLHLIGTGPDFYEEFNVLYKDPRYIDDLINYIIFEKKLRFDFKYINPETCFAKSLMRKLWEAPFLFKKIYGFISKPYVDLTREFKDRLKERVKRGEKKAKSKYNQELKLEFDTEKNLEYFQEFMDLHIKRWQGGFFAKKKNAAFIREIFLNTDMTVLSRLYFNEDNRSIAYNFSYKDSKKVLWGMQAAHNDEFLDISPSIILLHETMINARDRGFKAYDLGQGGYEYKYDFANEDSILFNITAYSYRLEHKMLYSSINFTRKCLKLIGVV